MWISYTHRQVYICTAMRLWLLLHIRVSVYKCIDVCFVCVECVCVCVCVYLKSLDNAVGLKGRHDEIEDPKWKEKNWSHDFWAKGSTEFPANTLGSPHHQNDYHNACLWTEQCDGEGQTETEWLYISILKKLFKINGLFLYWMNQSQLYIFIFYQ